MHTFPALKRLLFVAPVLAALALPAPALAGDIATVNIQTILKDSAAAKSTRTQIDAKRDQYQAELKKIEENLRKEDQALAEQRSLLAPDALEQKRQEFRDKVTNAQKDVQEKKLRLDVAYGKALGEIQEQVSKIVSSMAKEKGVIVVIPTSQLVYATPDLDITAPVLAQLDKNLSSVKIDFNAPLPVAPQGEQQ